MTKRKASAMILTVLALLILMVPVTPARARFVLSGWESPDEYGQGIELIYIYENSTGDWETFGSENAYPNDGPPVFEWNASVAIKLRCYTLLNGTLVGAINIADGKNFFRHSVTVTNLSDEIVFSQQNFTFYSSEIIDPPIWSYAYDVVLNFLPDYGQIYTVTVTYEVYYLEE